jgi:hypothetical protein
VFVSPRKLDLLLQLLEEATDNRRECFEIREFTRLGEVGYLITWLSYSQLEDWQVDTLKVHSLKNKLKPFKEQIIECQKEVKNIEEEIKKYTK